MAIKNKNLMMSLTESLNENKKQEIANFKKLKEATEDNISYVRYLLDTAEDMDDVQQAIYQIDDSDLENEVQLMFDSCSENDSLEEVISLVISTMEDNAEYDEEVNEPEIDDARKDSIEKGLVSEDENFDEPNEDDRKNTLIAKKDELESRLGEILQSIKDKQMDTEEFRKLSREAADLDSEIMDLDNQIHGVYESVNEAELFNMDEYKDLADEDDSVNIKELKMIQDYAVRKTKEIINYVYYNAPYSGIGDNILNDMLNVIKESLPDMNESINESDEDVKKGVVDQLISTGMTKEQAEQTANGICNIFKNKVGSNQVVNEDINPDGFSNDENLQQYFKDLKNLPDEVEIDNVKYKMEQYGGSGDNCYAIYTDINNNDSYIKVFYSLNKIENGSYKGISKINGVSDLRESAKPIKEAAITEKNLLKSQGNVYMFECKGNSDFSHIVGENYNEEENTLENVETYNNKEDADKDYLGRCEITTESQKPRDIEDGLDESDDDTTYKVKSYHVENMGGGTMAIFGQLEDGRYFAGNEDGLNLYDIDVWPYYEKDTSEEEFQQLEKDHNIGSIDSIDNKFEYEKIISQTNF